MKTRIITGISGGILLILLTVFADINLISILAFSASLIGLYEFYKMTGILKNKPAYILGIIGAIFIFSGNIYLRNSFSLLLCIWLVISFITFLIFHEKFEISELAVVILSVFYIPNLFSYIPLTFGLEDGRIVIWIALIGAFITDTFAYFTGVFFGKHKLCPKISPKKTIEGSVGGTIGCGLFFILFGYLSNKYFKTDFYYIHLFVCGILSAVLAQFGDLFASILKRKYSIKDYGNLFPGHGGIMDRFDSLLFVTPFIYFLFNI